MIYLKQTTDLTCEECLASIELKEQEFQLFKSINNNHLIVYFVIINIFI